MGLTPVIKSPEKSQKLSRVETIESGVVVVVGVVASMLFTTKIDNNIKVEKEIDETTAATF
jgi:hypothetical protein